MLEEFVNDAPSVALPQLEQLSVRLQFRTLDDPFYLNGTNVVTEEIVFK